MSSRSVPEDLILAQEARALRLGPEVARAVDVRAIASAVTDEARHGKAGTARSPSGVFIWRVSRAIEQARDRCRIREQQTQLELERYAQLWVSLLATAAERRSSPAQLAGALRALRANGFPKLNPRIAEQLAALGAEWPVPLLTAPPKPETTGRARRKSREDAHARAHAQTG